MEPATIQEQKVAPSSSNLNVDARNTTTSGSTHVTIPPLQESRPPAYIANKGDHDSKMSGNGILDKVTHTNIQEINKYMKLANIFGGLLLVVSGLIAIFKISTYGQFILAMYTIVLGITLMLFEFRSHFHRFNELIKSNFGFLFTPIGRACFLVFISLLSFSLGVFGIIVGILFVFLTAFNFFLIYRHPAYKEASLQANSSNNTTTTTQQQQQGRPTSPDNNV